MKIDKKAYYLNCCLATFLTLAIFACISCQKKPDVVLSHDEMVNLLVDVHKAEAVIGAQSSQFYNDSLKKMVKQSVFERHNVTSEQVDSSFVWYGQHIEEYNAIYDDVIAKLEGELADLNIAANSEVLPLDSMNLWPGPLKLKLYENSPVRYLSFQIDADENSMKGDNYQWQMKLLNMPESSRALFKMTVMAEYFDGTGEYRYSTQSADGWLRVNLATDSTKYIKNITGYMTASELPVNPIYVDSISLIRTRVDESLYNRHGQQKFPVFPF